MAVLQDTASNSAVRCLFNTKPSEGLAPSGTFRAKIIDIVDKFKVERRKFDNPSETEIVDLTQFRFGYRDKTGTAWILDSRAMKISGNEKSALYAFLKMILGTAPKMGWDYTALKGRECLLTVEHMEGKSATYAAIATLSPLPEGMDAPSTPPAPTRAPVQQPATPAPSVESAPDSALPF